MSYNTNQGTCDHIPKRKLNMTIIEKRGPKNGKEKRIQIAQDQQHLELWK